MIFFINTRLLLNGVFMTALTCEICHFCYREQITKYSRPTQGEVAIDACIQLLNFQDSEPKIISIVPSVFKL